MNIQKPKMKKNSGEIFEPLQVDPITGEYYVVIPENIVNDLSWYEDTEIKLELSGNELILSEKED
jgi:hypothetical protein